MKNPKKKEKMVEISTKELNLLKSIVKKYEKLESEVSSYYYDEEGNELNEPKGDLCDIGELVSMHFGLM